MWKGWCHGWLFRAVQEPPRRLLRAAGGCAVRDGGSPGRAVPEEAAGAEPRSSPVLHSPGTAAQRRRGTARTCCGDRSREPRTAPQRSRSAASILRQGRRCAPRPPVRGPAEAAQARPRPGPVPAGAGAARPRPGPAALTAEAAERPRLPGVLGWAAPLPVPQRSGGHRSERSGRSSA